MTKQILGGASTGGFLTGPIVWSEWAAPLGRTLFVTTGSNLQSFTVKASDSGAGNQLANGYYANPTELQGVIAEAANALQLNGKPTATTAEAIAGNAAKIPDVIGVHAAFNKYGVGNLQGNGTTLNFDVVSEVPNGSYIVNSATNITLPAGESKDGWVRCDIRAGIGPTAQQYQEFTSRSSQQKYYRVATNNVFGSWIMCATNRFVRLNDGTSLLDSSIGVGQYYIANATDTPSTASANWYLTANMTNNPNYSIAEAVSVAPIGGAVRKYTNLQNNGAWIGWVESFHTGNTNFNTFSDVAGVSPIEYGFVFNSTTAFIVLRINSKTRPTGITATGTFELRNTGGAVIKTAIPASDITVDFSSDRIVRLVVPNLTGLVSGATVELRALTTESKIEVNF